VSTFDFYEWLLAEVTGSVLAVVQHQTVYFSIF